LLFPVVVRFSATDEIAALRATLVDGTRIALGLIVGVTICLVTFADRLVAAWMGPGFSGSLPPLYVLAAAGVVLVAAGPLGNLLLARGRERIVAFSCLGEAIVNATLSVVLVRKYGIVGAAVGTFVSVTIANVLVQMPAACRLLSIPVPTFLRDVTVPSVIALAPTVLAAWILRTTFTPSSLFEVVGSGAALGCVYVLAFVGAGLRSTDRARYFSPARRAAMPSSAPASIT
jgi:O-antigen/teichoic acid export membrane protein